MGMFGFFKLPSGYATAIYLQKFSIKALEVFYFFVSKIY